MKKNNVETKQQRKRKSLNLMNDGEMISERHRRVSGVKRPSVSNEGESVKNGGAL